ncbi:MAG TPA: hypothetical protein VGV17_05655 [Bosea sp. (in: a-proteobacteria)]|jgi:hypothetical protein|uniref:hypothetical protein n=1 Tax=Bosea sp. (in: a-proteobacteria) TaxID=1871050 RepID=UPI002DDC937D|nr:hypothetical protein [Bosea sp. (in: a-proteobacteria)]HEV2553225.1 hypothetical protein [Bosea sp. (in: a-proteobacteria)]
MTSSTNANDAVERALLEAAAIYKPRAGEIVPLGAVHIKLQKAGFSAAEINAAFSSMEAKGWITGSQSPAHFKLTEAGFAEMPGAMSPTVEDVERAVLEVTAAYTRKANEIVPIMGVNMKLQEKGYRADEIADAFESMIAKGWVVIAGTFFKLTPEGAAELA